MAKSDSEMTALEAKSEREGIKLHKVIAMGGDMPGAPKGARGASAKREMSRMEAAARKS